MDSNEPSDGADVAVSWAGWWCPEGQSSAVGQWGLVILLLSRLPVFVVHQEAKQLQWGGFRGCGVSMGQSGKDFLLRLNIRCISASSWVG